MSGSPTETGKVVEGLTATCGEALEAADGLLAAARQAVFARLAPDGRIDGRLLEAEQFAAHGFAWMATCVEALRQTLDWARRLEARGALGELEPLMLQCGFGEYLAQLSGGIALSQVEILRPADMGLGEDAVGAFLTGPVRTLIAGGNTAAARQRIAALIADGNFGEGCKLCSANRALSF